MEKIKEVYKKYEHLDEIFSDSKKVFTPNSPFWGQIIYDLWDAIKKSLEPCIWEGKREGYFETTCGMLWEFIADGPYENNVKYCHFCGKPVKYEPYDNKNIDDD